MRDGLHLSYALPKMQWAFNTCCFYGHKALGNLNVFSVATHILCQQSHNLNREFNYLRMAYKFEKIGFIIYEFHMNSLHCMPCSSQIISENITPQICYQSNYGITNWCA